MAKIYKPEDFPVKDPKAKRSEIVEKVSAAIESNSFIKENDNTISLKITGDYDQNELIDFQSYYSLLGDWSKIETSRNLSPNSEHEIKITLVK